MATEKKYTDDFLINELKRFYIENNKTPRHSDFTSKNGYPDGSTYKRFGGWNDALRLAGLNVIEKRKPSKWTFEKDAILYELYPCGDWNVLLDKLNPHTKADIHTRASDLNIKRIDENQWTQEQLEILKQNYEFGSVKLLQKLLPNHSYVGITSKAKRLGLKTREYWSDEEIDKLYTLFPNYYSHELVQFFPNRNKDTIQVVANKLGLTKDINFIRTNRKEKIKIELINRLKEFASILRRTPTTHEITRNEDMGGIVSYHRYFGSYSEACIIAGLDPNCGSFGDFTNVLYSKNNDVCYSNAEQIITNYFIDNNVKYEKEMLYKEIIEDDACGLRRMDWLINEDIIVEYFGLPNNKEYAVKMNYKINLIEKHNVKSIFLFPEDINTKNFERLTEKLKSIV